MGLQSLGRSQLSKMIALAPVGTVEAVFRLFDAVDYDPNTGQASPPVVIGPIRCFLSKSDAKETKDTAAKHAGIALVFPDGLLPRRPDVQDEAMIGDITYKVLSVEVDAMGVQMKVYVLQS